MPDIRERYEAVVQKVDTARQKQIEAKATHQALLNRQEELAKEAAALGVADLSKLDDTISALEDEIATELGKIEDDLVCIEAGQTPKPPTASVIQAKPSEMIDIDDLLLEGGQSTRKTP